MASMPASQPSLFPDSASDAPEGFAYQPEMITAEEETALAGRLAELPFVPFQFRGFEGRRRVVSFGWRYDFNGPGLVQAEPMPDWLRPLRDRAAAFAGVPPDDFAHVLINEYQEGAPIGWHRDRPAFEKVVGVSLFSPCVMRLRRRTEAGGFERRSIPLAPRSAYLLSGEARNVWEHSIPEARALRYSITFRNLRRAANT
jgi:alkylated DNA repair dioxygenase AlkB